MPPLAAPPLAGRRKTPFTLVPFVDAKSCETQSPHAAVNVSRFAVAASKVIQSVTPVRCTGKAVAKAAYLDPDIATDVAPEFAMLL